MSGHSQFSNIKHRKDVQDAKRAKLFTKIKRQIIVAAKSGILDPSTNSALRSAIMAAKKINMPKDKIEAVLKNIHTKGDNYSAIRYEAYGPYHTALVIQALTDNRNRTAAEIRHILTNAGGNLAESGSASFLFMQRGLLIYNREIIFEQLFEIALALGAFDIREKQETFEVLCELTNFAEIKEGLYKKFGDAEINRLYWQANDFITLNTEQKTIFNRLIDALQDNDDVQYIDSNVL